jgi:nucleotide-binding universal stress UspA family protein
MFRNILVPLDGSPFAEQALPWALSLARRAGAGLDLVRVHVLYALKDPAASFGPYDPAEDAECRREEQLYLDATAGWLAAVSPVPMTSDVVFGPEADGILGRARAVKADLLVMTTHARGPVGRFLLSSVAGELVRRVETPVLLVRPHEPAPGVLPEPLVEEVVVALDGSGLAEQALGPAVGLARLLEARCTLLRVVESNGSPSEAAQEEARAYLEHLAGRLQGQGLSVRPRVVVAPHAAEAIIEQARGGGLVALATHGRGGLGRMLLGSVADKVIRGASAPVLVYRPVAG